MKDLNDLSNFLGDQIEELNKVKAGLGKRIFTPDDILEPEVDGIDTRDYPDFCDAYLSYGLVADKGKLRELTDEECMQVTEDYGEWIHELVMDSF